MENYSSALVAIEKIQVEAQEKMVEKIIDEGLSIERYQQIIVIVQTDPQLQQKFENLMH